MTNEAPEGSPGPAPKNRAFHYVALFAVVIVLVFVFVAVR